MEELNVESERPWTSQRGPRSSQRRYHGAVDWFLLPLSFLFLAGIIGLTLHCHDSARHSLTEANLTERLQDRENQLSSLTEQRDLLTANLTEMTKELQRLQKKTCSEGWKSFSRSCYLFSKQTKTWEESKQDCRYRRADLVIVDSLEEQEFLTVNLKRDTWIGLSDRDNEGIWKWIDGTPLTQAYWKIGEPNNAGNHGIGENCVHLIPDTETEENWNDLKCDASKQWICEEK
ncbi:CD209 antigen-like protein E [Labrus bergylta]|uniref:CD209 antigen-like protein E n=1 Tax=Labrus bergylta TaxID=56723 RepID=UPI003313C5F5